MTFSYLKNVISMIKNFVFLVLTIMSHNRQVTERSKCSNGHLLRLFSCYLGLFKRLKITRTLKETNNLDQLWNSTNCFDLPLLPATRVRWILFIQRSSSKNSNNLKFDKGFWQWKKSTNKVNFPYEHSFCIFCLRTLDTK